MTSKRTTLRFNIAGACVKSEAKQEDRAAWFVILTIGDNIFAFHRPLCGQCDYGRQTSLRALLRSLMFVANTAHELTKVGGREPDDHALCDARPMAKDRFAVEVLTPEQNGCLANFGNFQYRAHLDLHHSIRQVIECLRQAGVHFRIFKESEEERIMDCTLTLAELACGEAASASCRTCRFQCGGNFTSMIEHIKRVHLKLDEVEEDSRVVEFAGRNPWWICGKCRMAFLDHNDFVRHQDETHNIDTIHSTEVSGETQPFSWRAQQCGHR
ncbi:hypothetical protein BWQ96_00622 [Gracilariopsis chorda]|uniref:C2H2-type domain-containing protein n=1 Tax=Gracilariopsis chorda TaxID=448386 RepID=A0A2V3J601_9FLOR|nr:hypothetical protein BWQ96_00622 [Gracilariopsis chorda]|eukprot:PXF49552.1 hypothetical protein BWQ96_00622 [Gracilariopsis chorda]